MLKKAIKRIYFKCKSLITGSFWYAHDLVIFRKLSRHSPNLGKFYFYPQLFDRSPASHTFDKHYVYMDRWAFKKLTQAKPETHVDVGSSIRFLSMASIVTKVKFVDIRPIKTDFDNFEFIEGSIVKMPFVDNSIDSLSCLHVAEHIGLGRYGDALDPEGTKKACKELARVLAPGGSLYFALPIGRPAVYFNAHRVHSPRVILQYFAGLKLKSFAAINDVGHFLPTALPESFEHANYACGLFEFTK